MQSMSLRRWTGSKSHAVDVSETMARSGLADTHTICYNIALSGDTELSFETSNRVGTKPRDACPLSDSTASGAAALISLQRFLLRTKTATQLNERFHQTNHTAFLLFSQFASLHFDWHFDIMPLIRSHSKHI